MANTRNNRSHILGIPQSCIHEDTWCWLFHDICNKRNMSVDFLFKQLNKTILFSQRREFTNCRTIFINLLADYFNNTSTTLESKLTLECKAWASDLSFEEIWGDFDWIFRRERNTTYRSAGLIPGTYISRSGKSKAFLECFENSCNLTLDSEEILVFAPFKFFSANDSCVENVLQ